MKSRMRLVLTLVSLLLSGCAGMTGIVTDVALEAVGLGTSSDSGITVDTELVIGDKEQSVNFDSTDSSSNVVNSDNVSYAEGIPYWQVALMSVLWLCLGLFLPQLAIRKK